ncbi:ceramidase [Gammaproteobacteria bacterium]|nr:ceramidase [Gammaproteobacteria bacterium]MDA9343007.1 ceramidase [Gammaproteobacteria bacterium]MDA9356133.1 ceramidase [Gammaproteobacteria bacterium]MDC1189626.1 ceramidase [Gammaproteobacteria bacterium]
MSSLTDKHWQPFYISLVLSGLFVIAFFVLSALGYIQSIESQGIIGDASRWCERVSGGLFREPVNTLSNLGFMVVGIYIFYTITTDTNTSSNNYFVGLTGISILYASAAIFLGPGSMLMHGTNSGWGGWADNLSMIMYILIPWLYNIFRMSNWTVRRFLEIYFSIVVIYAVMRWISGWGLGINLELFSVSIGLWAISEFLFKFWSPLFRFLSGFVGFVVLALFGTTPLDVIANFSEYWWVILFWIPGLLSNKKPTTTRTYKWYFLGMVAYFSAFIIWSTGVPDHALCRPDSLIQAHGIWHLLSAVATYCFFLHYRSESA